MINKALEHLEKSWQRTLDELGRLVRIGGVSADAVPNETLKKSADAVRATLAEAGLEHTAVIDFPGSHPYVYGDWLHAEGAPTVLLYGHHDVQPPGRPAKWVSPAFEPVVRNGRLYGRGSVDDKAGVMVHVAACGAWLAAAKRLPVNVKFIVEGEEEIGSPRLAEFLDAYKDKLAADFIVLTDTANLEEGLPSLTVSLRGLAGILVEVTALDHPIHSGMWGGPVPDPVIALSKAIGELTDADGRVASHLAQGVRKPTGDELAEIQRLPFDEPSFRKDAGMVAGSAMVGDAAMPVWGRIWRQPSVTVVAFEARPIEGSSNQIIESARARVSLRLVADMDPVASQDALVMHFETRVPWGLSVRVTRESVSGWWMMKPEGPAFAAARRAMEAGYGRAAAAIGCGGTIPFVEPFARVLGGVPALLTGVEDPICNAHGENESLSVEDFKRATRSAVHLYDELSRAK